MEKMKFILIFIFALSTSCQNFKKKEPLNLGLATRGRQQQSPSGGSLSHGESGQATALGSGGPAGSGSLGSSADHSATKGKDSGAQNSSHSESSSASTSTSTSPSSSDSELIEEETLPPLTTLPHFVLEGTPKVALILGPGGLRSYAHIGVLEELHKAKIPINQIVGIEMGALVAALYAQKGQTYDTEWQMFKLKESDFSSLNFLNSGIKPKEISTLNPFLKSSFSNNKAEDAKVPFICPAFHLHKQMGYLMNRGPWIQMLPYCLSFYPLFSPFQTNVAGINQIRSLVKNLKNQHGINYIIYVDLLGEKEVRFVGKVESETNLLWKMVADYIEVQKNSFDAMIRVPLSDVNLYDFNKRREALQRGRESAQKSLNGIIKELGM